MASTSKTLIRKDTHGAVVLLTMDHPPVNALNSEMYAALLERIGELESDPEVRVMVLAAAGTRAFCAGADIKEFDQFFEGDKAYEICKITHEINNRIELLPQVTIAAMEGACLGGGGELALAFDLRIASTDVRIGFPEIKIGQVPATGGTMRLPWLIGESAARGMLLTGDAIGAERAFELGLFHLLTPPGLACSVAMERAQQLALRPAQSLLAVKRSILRNRDQDVERATERDTRISEWVFHSGDAREGHYSFLEKREPRYRHQIAPLAGEVPLPPNQKRRKSKP